MMTAFNRVCVIGAGAWGTALAGVAARAGRAVTLYARDTAMAAKISATRENPRLPGVPVDRSIDVTHDIAAAAGADILVIAVPAQQSRAALTALAPHLAAGTPVIASAKGIEHGTRRFMTEVIAETAPQAVPAILSGPSFAADVWGLGATLFHAIAGYRPFPDGDADSDDVRGRFPQLVDLAYALPDKIPDDVAKVVLATLEPDPADRPLPHEIAEGLQPALERAPKGRLAGWKVR